MCGPRCSRVRGCSHPTPLMLLLEDGYLAYQGHALFALSPHSALQCLDLQARFGVRGSGDAHRI
jgi:hypothetical protein